MSSNESSPHSTPAETDCLVCGNGKSYTKNKILFCDGPGCDIPVHQKCYGVAVVPEGDWYCQRCEDKIPVENTPSVCCPQKTGAFKRTTVPNQYIHVACARLHPHLDESQVHIAFDTALTKRNICCLCNSDFGICSKCDFDGCERMMHVTCAQAESLIMRGKAMYCEDHRDQAVLDKIMESKSRYSSNSSSASASSGHRQHRGRHNRNYAESSGSELDMNDDDDDEEEGDEDDDDHTHDEDSDRASESDVDMEKDDAQYTTKKAHRRKSSSQSNNSSSSSSRGHAKNKSLIDGTTTQNRRRKARSTDSEEIEVDDSEAILGSGGGGANYSNGGQRKRIKSQQQSSAAKSGSKASAEESQRQRLFNILDKSKRKPSTSGTSSSLTGLGNGADLSSLVIRNAGGALAATAAATLSANSQATLGSAAPIPPLQGEVKKKLPSVSRQQHTPSSSSMDPSPGSSPSMSGPTDRFPTVNNNGANNHYQHPHSRNSKGLSFDIDMTNNSGSTGPSPITSNFSNTTSPMQTARMNHQQSYQQRSPRTSTTSATTTGQVDSSNKELQNTIQMLQSKVTSLESALQANPHTIGSGPGQDLQYKFDVLQHAHGQEKMRNMTLRQNLRDLFSYMQIPVTSSSSTSDHHQQHQHIESTFELQGDKLDDYVQALRDMVVGPNTDGSSNGSSSSSSRQASTPASTDIPSSAPANSSSSSSSSSSRRPGLDPKKRDFVIDKVLKELAL
ncbi:Zinc finger protein zfp-1 [Podila humilis]|nr:Zinc finger protein zfp-1 [Podila humilis]